MTAKMQPGADVVSMARVPERVACEFQVDLGGGRVLGLKTTFPQDADRASMNDVLDRLYEAGERQKAKPEIDQLMKGVITNRRILASNKHAMEVAEADHRTRVEEIKKGILKVREGLGEAEAEDQKVFAERQTRGEYKPSPRLEQQRRSAKAEQVRLAGEIDKLEAERAKALRDLGIERDKAEREIAECEKAIEERRKIIGAAV